MSLSKQNKSAAILLKINNIELIIF